MNRKVLSAFLLVLGAVIIVALYVDGYSHSRKLKESLKSVENLQQTITSLEHQAVRLQRSLVIGSIAGALLIIVGLFLAVARPSQTSGEATGQKNHRSNGVGDGKSHEAEEKLELANRTLKKANDELTFLSYSISHDLKAPLRAINGFSEILIEEHSQNLDANGRKALSIIQQNATRMDALLNDMLALAKIGNASLEIQRVKMHQLVRIAVDAQPKTHEATIEILPLPDATGDPQLLRQLWEILISNAIKFSSKEEPPIIQIGYDQTGDAGHYWIDDNGVGFDPRYSDKLFKLFSRLHPKKEFEGSGAGLAIARKIVEMHGGTIWSENKVQRGARFCFSLPSHAAA